ncbi:MAG: peptidoglycan-binding domain-containing protein [Collinsella sp.]
MAPTCAGLQKALNVLGFACGEDDGYFGPHTEAALQQFQENVGLFADGMAFQDTTPINRLHHVWRATLGYRGRVAHRFCPRGQRTRAFPDCRHR